MKASELINWLNERKATQAFVDLSERYLEELPQAVEFESDEWNVNDWQNRYSGETRNLFFSKVSHKELRTLTKLHVLEKRRNDRIQFGAADTMVKVSRALSEALDISMPLKILLFVLVDGWTLVVRSLALSFGV